MSQELPWLQGFIAFCLNSALQSRNVRLLFVHLTKLYELDIVGDLWGHFCLGGGP